MENAAYLITAILLLGALIVAFGWLLKCCADVLDWLIGDAFRTGESGLLFLIVLFFFFPWGLIVWLIFRPDPDRYDHG